MREKKPKSLPREEEVQHVGSAENSSLQAVEQLEKGEVEKKGEMKKTERESGDAMQGKRKAKAEEHPGLYMTERYLHTERDILNEERRSPRSQKRHKC